MEDEGDYNFLEGGNDWIDRSFDVEKNENEDAFFSEEKYFPHEINSDSSSDYKELKQQELPDLEESNFSEPRPLNTKPAARNKNPHKNVPKNVGRKFKTCLLKAILSAKNRSKDLDLCLISNRSVVFYLQYRTFDSECFEFIHNFYKNNKNECIYTDYHAWVKKNINLQKRDEFFRLFTFSDEQNFQKFFFYKVTLRLFKSFLDPANIKKYYSGLKNATTRKITRILVEQKFAKAFKDPDCLLNMKLNWEDY